MTTQEKIYLATKAFDKNWDFETFKYSDDLYGREDLVEDVWEYVDEIKLLGIPAFKNKYNGIEMYI